MFYEELKARIREIPAIDNLPLLGDFNRQANKVTQLYFNGFNGKQNSR